MSSRNFHIVDDDGIRALAENLAVQGSRRINAIHLHHTLVPDAAFFNSLVIRLGSAEAAGLELCRRMWRVHTEHNNWTDIAQHVTIDPTGAIWLCRQWELPPASASGFNGNESVGPFMIAMIGDFDIGREQPTSAQSAAMVNTIATIQQAFTLDANAFSFHNELNSGKSCPGHTLERATILASLKQHHRNSQAGSPASRVNSSAALFAASFVQSRKSSAGDQQGSSLGAHEINAELEENTMSDEALRLLTALPGGRNSGPQAARGNSASSAALTTSMLDSIRPHVINLRQGQFSGDGDFRSDRKSVKELVDTNLGDWIKRQIAAKKTPRVMIYAHGGLVDEGAGLAYAHRMYKWWLEQGIYPVFFVWETGVWESVLQVLEEQWRRSGSRGEARGIDDWLRERADDAVEALVRAIGRDPWTLMNLGARRASEPTSEAGATYFARRLGKLRRQVKKVHKIELEVHGVGHSAGAIFQSYFLGACARVPDGLPLETLSLLAPACTVELYDTAVAPRLDAGAIKHLNIFCLDRETERVDPTVPAYSKSLLHLVSKGFERHAPAPLLGMQESFDRSERLRQAVGLSGRDRPEISVVFSPTGDTPDELHRANATVHGGFSSDARTLRALALRMRALPIDPALPDPPAPSGGRGIANDHSAIRPLQDQLDTGVYQILFSERSFPTPFSTAGAPMSASIPLNPAGAALSGVRQALCIGINGYAPPYELAGCVNDAEQWASTLSALGFEVRSLPERESTHTGILDAIDRLVCNTRAGDVIVLQYAGHGIQFDDKDGDEDDGKDEALVPIDSNGRLFIADDELWDRLEKVHEQASIYVFMDCCHSMTNTRAMQFNPDHKARAIKSVPSWREAHRARLAASGQGSLPARHSNEHQRHLKYGACTDLQLAYETKGQGKFTRAALSVLKAREQGLSNAAFIEKVIEQLGADANQTPGLDCRPSWRSRPFLGGILEQ